MTYFSYSEAYQILPTDNEKEKNKIKRVAGVIQPDSQIEIDRRSEEHNKWVE